MIVVICGWIFISFVYFKFILGHAFSGSMSVVGSMVLAVSLGAAIFGFTGIYSKILLPHNLGLRRMTRGQMLSKTFPAFFCFFLLFLIWSLVVLEGFDSRIASDVDLGDIFKDISRGRFDDDHAGYLSIILGPILLHYLMVIISSFNAVIVRNDHDY